MAMLPWVATSIRYFRWHGNLKMNEPLLLNDNQRLTVRMTDLGLEFTLYEYNKVGWRRSKVVHEKAICVPEKHLEVLFDPIQNNLARILQQLQRAMPSQTGIFAPSSNW